MKYRSIRRLTLLSAACALLFASASCGKTDDGRVPVYTVKGHVFVNGQPASNAQVFFHPQDAKQKLFPHGRVDSDGSFQLATYELNDGAPAGDYSVTLIWSDAPPSGSAADAPEGPDRLNGQYADIREPRLQAHVAAEPNELAPFEIEIENSRNEVQPGITNDPI